MATPSKIKDTEKLKKISQVIESEQNNSLTHSTIELTIYGIEDRQAIQRAVKKTVRILKNAKSDPQCHVQSVWLESESGASDSWRLSDTAFRLILMDMAEENPALSASLVRISERFLK